MVSGPVVDLPLGPDGQVARTEIRDRAARGAGVLLEPSGPFTDLLHEPAPAEDVARRLAAVRFRGAPLPIGELALAPGVPFELDARGFGRHTFLSGSPAPARPTRSGVLLEQPPGGDDLRVVVLDPELGLSFHLAERRADADPAAAARYEEPARPDRRAERHGRRLASASASGELAAAQQAALLRLIQLPTATSTREIAAIAETPSSRRASRRSRGCDEHEAQRLRAASDEHRRARLRRVVARARRVSSSRRSSMATPAASWRTLARSRSRAERSLVAGSVLERALAAPRRTAPVAIVIDEAHNVCPASARGRAHRARHRGRDQDRGRGAQVRPLPDRRDPAAAEGA